LLQRRTHTDAIPHFLSTVQNKSASAEFYCPLQLDFPGVTVEAVKVVGTCKASTPNQLITYFDESHIDLNNAVDTEGHKQVVDIKVMHLDSDV